MAVVVVVADQRVVEPAVKTEFIGSEQVTMFHPTTYYFSGFFQKKWPSPPVVIRWLGSLLAVNTGQTPKHRRGAQASDKVGLLLIPRPERVRSWDASRACR